jgi:hypothetical protein
MKHWKTLSAIVMGAGLVSACSVIAPVQTVVVTTPEPGAEVYLALHGRTSLGINSQEFMGHIPTGEDNTGFTFVGTTPLTHTFRTTRHVGGVGSPGEFSTAQNTIYSEATVRVVHADGYREERRIRIDNAVIQLSFDRRGAHP